LAINTAFMNANLALKTKDGKIILKNVDAKSKHSENVLKTIDEICQEAKIDVMQVNTVAVVIGPGSFTGLRIGVAIAKALGCVNKNLKFISCSSLDLMAYIIAKQKMCQSNFVCALNALSNLFFVGFFDKNGIKIKEEQMIVQEEFEKLDFPVFSLKGDLMGFNVKEIEISSNELLDFALFKESKNDFVECDDLLPHYIRLSQAEAQLKNLKKDYKNS